MSCPSYTVTLLIFDGIWIVNGVSIHHVVFSFMHTIILKQMTLSVTLHTSSLLFCLMPFFLSRPDASFALQQFGFVQNSLPFWNITLDCVAVKVLKWNELTSKTSKNIYSFEMSFNIHSIHNRKNISLFPGTQLILIESFAGLNFYTIHMSFACFFHTNTFVVVVRIVGNAGLG